MNAHAFTSPYEIIRGDSAKGLVLVADHARRCLPAEYGTLGIPATDLERHIAYDIGAEAVTRILAAKLQAPAILGGFSRLLIDPNRGLDDPTLIRQLYDGTIIPGNYPLSAAERQTRIARYYTPYHNALAALVNAAEDEGQQAPLLISIHSFTPFLLGRRRPWEVGVLWDRDNRAAGPLIEMLRAGGDLTVGDNEPYDGSYPGDTMHTHATMKGFPYALIEIRQDLIADEAGAAAWAAKLAPMLEALNARPDMHRTIHFGSRNDEPQRRTP